MYVYTRMHWMHMQNNRYERVQSYVYIYALDDAYATIDPNMCNHVRIHICIGYNCKTIDMNMCAIIRIHIIHWMHFAKQSIQKLCAIKCIHKYIGCIYTKQLIRPVQSYIYTFAFGCICKTIDTNVCNQSYVYTYALNAYATINTNV
jgi:hypothetical protein